MVKTMNFFEQNARFFRERRERIAHGSSLRRSILSERANSQPCFNLKTVLKNVIKNPQTWFTEATVHAVPESRAVAHSRTPIA